MRKSDLTPGALIIGLITALIMTAANVYLGLYAGLTVSASIPAAVIAAAVYRFVLRRSGIYEANIVQTIASAGESLAAGVIFTVPALLIVGAWTEFHFWPTTLIAICGGLIGVVFMIPLRKAIIEDDKTLPFPESVACSMVLKSADEQGTASAKSIFGGLFLGAGVKFFNACVLLLVESLQGAFVVGQKVFLLVFDSSPAMIGIGYIVGLSGALNILAGTVVAWLAALPFTEFQPEWAALSTIDWGWKVWSTQVRYIGVGTMLVGGIASLYSVRTAFRTAMREARSSVKKSEISNKDMNQSHMMMILAACYLTMFCLYNHILSNYTMSFLTATLMFIAAFPFVGVSCYIVGIIGNSNNPMSGITIGALLTTASILSALGYHGENAILATLGIAAVVCCAVATAADCAQDLKTGYIIGANPRSQQYAQCFGVICSAFVIAPVLTLLHAAYGIGTGLKAPQATLFASLSNAFFGNGNLPKDMVLMGVGIGVASILINMLLGKTKIKFRVLIMPMALGMYLPIGLTSPLVMGALIKYFLDRKSHAHEGTDNAVLLASGIVAGESIMGVAIAGMITLGISAVDFGLSPGVRELITAACLVFVGYAIYRSRKSSPA